MQSFAISHIAYVAAYHNWKTAERQKLNAIIRKAYREILGLYPHASTDKLLELGVHNTLEEIEEAVSTAQRNRLMQTRTGRYILKRLGIHGQESPKEQESTTVLPEGIRRGLQISPLPRHMHPEHNAERRKARARTLIDTHGTDTGALYVDAARYPDRTDTYVAVVIAATTGEIFTAGSIRAKTTQQAEEVAIALALTNPKCTTILSDSRSAILSYANNNVSESAVRLCGALPPRTVTTTVKWFPAHMGLLHSTKGHSNRNEEADQAARALTGRDASGCPDSPSAEQEPEEDSTINTYSGVLEWYRSSRRTMPPPHPRLTRQEAVTYRQLQTNSLLTPVLARHMCPEVYASDKCKWCASERATTAHILWDCRTHPTEAKEKGIPPQFITATRSCDYNTQLLAVQLVTEALDNQRPESDPSDGLRVSPG